MHLRKRRHLYWVVGNECRLNEGALAELTEELVDKFTLTDGLIYFHALRQAELTNLFFGLAIAVETGLLLNSFEDRKTAERCLIADNLTVRILYFWFAVDSHTDSFEQLFGEAHHPVIVFVWHIKLHTSKFRVMVLVHTLISEVFTDFVYTIETAYDKTLQIKLGSDTHVHIDVERIKMSDEWTGTGTTGDRLQDRGLNLCVALSIEEGTHGAKYNSTLEESILYTIVNHEVYITLACAHLWVVKFVISDTIFIFYDWEWL